MRGAISLVAALSIPLVTSAGAPFPHRDLIIFLTFCVIVSTLVLQGLSLPWFIRLLGIDREGRRERAEDGHREIEARRRAAEASLKLLTARRGTEAYPGPLIDRMEELYRYRNDQFRAHLDGDHDGAVQHGTHAFNLQTELIAEERRVMLGLREQDVIDDGILRRVEKDLDLQEMRLRQGIAEWNLSADVRQDYSE
jgi:CPA1 family monovalent cation:H+ antiporter